MYSPDPALATRSIVTTRVFDAPRELVYRMWTEPAHLTKWWGPTGFSLTMEEMDVRPGGQWRFVMHGPDGRDYSNHSVYLEVVPLERLVYEHKAPNFVATAVFEAEGPRTRVTLDMVFATAELREHIATQFHAVEGAVQTFDRLGAELAALPR